MAEWNWRTTSIAEDVQKGGPACDPDMGNERKRFRATVRESKVGEGSARNLRRCEEEELDRGPGLKQRTTSSKNEGTM